jgi:hypothetical protein
MNQRSEEGLFDVLEKELRASDEPLDCVELYNKSMAVREHASSPNRVSDYLGNMWRKGLLVRLPAPRGDGTKSRWLYAWKNKGPKKVVKPPIEEGFEYDKRLNAMLNKAGVSIEEDGRRIIITTEFATITVQAKGNSE